MLLQVFNGMSKSSKLSSITGVTSKFSFTRIQHYSLLAEARESSVSVSDPKSRKELEGGGRAMTAFSNY